jgi:hypothetical protein
LATLETEVAKHAELSGATKLREDDLKAVDGLAESLIDQIPNTPYDPEHNRGDAERERRHKSALEEADIDAQAIVEADAHLRARQREQADADTGRVKPLVSAAIFMLFVFGLAMSFAPTVKDVKDVAFVTIWDQVSGWLLAILAGWLLGAMIVAPTLATHEGSERGPLNWMGLAAAIGFGVANLILRESQAVTVRDHLIAIGLTAWEAMIVVFLEHYAQKFRGDHTAWMQQERGKATAAARRGAAEAQRAAAIDRHALREAELAAFVAYVDARSVLHERRAEITEAAKATARHIYQLHVNRNFGTRIGRDWRAA